MNGVMGINFIPTREPFQDPDDAPPFTLGADPDGDDGDVELADGNDGDLSPNNVDDDDDDDGDPIAQAQQLIAQGQADVEAGSDEIGEGEDIESQGRGFTDDDLSGLGGRIDRIGDRVEDAGKRLRELGLREIADGEKKLRELQPQMTINGNTVNIKSPDGKVSWTLTGSINDGKAVDNITGESVEWSGDPHVTMRDKNGNVTGTFDFQHHPLLLDFAGVRVLVTPTDSGGSVNLIKQVAILTTDADGEPVQAALMTNFQTGVQTRSVSPDSVVISDDVIQVRQQGHNADDLNAADGTAAGEQLGAKNYVDIDNLAGKTFADDDSSDADDFSAFGNDLNAELMMGNNFNFDRA